MAAVRHWTTKRKPAFVKSLAPIPMTALSSTNMKKVLLKESQYQLAIEADVPYMTDLPSRLYPLSITFAETNTNLTIASSSRLLIRDLIRRLETYSNATD